MKITRGITLCFLCVMVSTAAFGGDNTLVIASVQKNLPLGKKTATLPPLVTEQYEYYDVHGSCENDLQREMAKKAIVWGDGKKYESVTSWHVKWHYGYMSDSHSCSADGFQVSVDIVFRYPRWQRTEDTPPALAGKWDEYMQHLMVHENEHRDMAVRAAEDLSRIISEMPPAQSCAALDRTVRSLARTRMYRLNDDERHYDEATNHGETQGAVFR